MNPIPHAIAGTIFLLTVASCSAVDSPDSRIVSRNLTESFDSYAVGSLPPGWRAGETNGKESPATWKIMDAASGGSGRVLSLTDSRNSGQTYNLCLFTGYSEADVKIRVKIIPGSGKEDQGGGIVWRAVDANSYYVARWNPLEKNLRAYKVVDGKRTQFASASTSALTSKDTPTLEIVAHGTQHSVTLDGTVKLDFTDDTFTNAGFMGLWTKADAATSFDDFVADAIAR